MEYELIDVDSHVQERPDCWTSRMSKAKWGDRIPHIGVVENPEFALYMVSPTAKKREGWFIDGQPRSPFPSICHAAMPDRETLPAVWDEVPKMVYDARERLKAMDRDGVGAQAFYPNSAGPAGDALQALEPDLEEECARAYNDMLVDEFLAVSPRFIPLAIMVYSDIRRTVAEVERSVKRGHKGVVMISTPHQRGLPHFNDRYWDPLWATVQDLGVPVNFHGSGGSAKMLFDILPGTSSRRSRAIRGSAGFSLQAQFFCNFLFSKVLDRFPGLTFVVAESGLGWVPYVLEACDHEWEQCRLYDHGYPTRPSDLFRRNCYVDFWYEQVGLQYRHVIGVDRIMWESDFPHPTSIWPESRKHVELSLKGVPEDERRQILVENAKRVYKL